MSLKFRLEIPSKCISFSLILITMITYWSVMRQDNFNPESLRGKRVLITGASAGIGEQMAYQYAKLGARLMLTARSEGKLKQVIENCREVGKQNGDYNYVIADMSHMKSTQNVIDEAVSFMGGIDYLVLNHILPHSMGEWMGSGKNLTLMDTLFDVNYRAYVYLASYALDSLEESNGSIVVVSSIAGRIPQPYVTAYSATKFALDGFFSGLRQELMMRKSSISITMCIIGLTETKSAIAEMTRFNLHYILKTVRAASPTDTAMAIIKGGALRQWEVYYPYWEAKSTILRDLIPETLSYFNRYMYSQRSNTT